MAMSAIDRKSTRLNSSHLVISYAVFCLKKQSEKNPLAQIRNPEHAGARFKKPAHHKLSTLPPAFAMFCSADLLNPCARSVLFKYKGPPPIIFSAPQAPCTK